MFGESMRMHKILPTMILAFGAMPLAITAQEQTAATPERATVAQVVDKIVAQERAEMNAIRKYSPLVETYIQTVRPDKELGAVPNGDKYFLGRAELDKGVQLEPLVKGDGGNGSSVGAVKQKFLASLGNMFSGEFLPRGFLQMIYLDEQGFDQQHYKFSYAGREFLGDVRCLIFDVDPLANTGKGRFSGRIWVEDQDFHIVRFNGSYGGSSKGSFYFNFDSWRENSGKNEWLPAYIYSEQGNVEYGVAKHSAFRPFKSQTRLWGYDLNREQEAQTLSSVEVEIQPEVRCRVLMTSTLESFTMGHTIVLSRGLIDVLPDETSLAAVLAHELGHVMLGHRMDTEFAFFNRVRFDEKDTFHHFGFARNVDEEEAANQKGIELLKKSPYQDKSGTAEAFFAALQKREKEVPNLISPHLGDRVPKHWTSASGTSDQQAVKTANAIVALPLGARIKVEPWDDRLVMLKAQPEGAVAEYEKMPFEVAPFLVYLTRQNGNAMLNDAGTMATRTDSNPAPAIAKP